MAHKIFAVPFADIYPHYITKAERKGRTQAEVDELIEWLTAYDQTALQQAINDKVTVEEFYAQATINPAATSITGSICGVKIQEIDDPLMLKIRYLDKLIDELAKGKSMAKIKRTLPDS